MRKNLLLFTVIVSGIIICGACRISAAEEAVSKTGWKEEISSDKQAIKEQRDDMKDSAEKARSEEKELRDQIKTARQSGDSATARQLKEKLKAAHRENVQKRKQDRKELWDARKELNKDRKAARSSRRGRP